MKGLIRHGYSNTDKETKQEIFTARTHHKINSVKLYRQTKDIDFVLRRYHISKASLMRWNRLYDGTKESLTPPSPPSSQRSHRVRTELDTQLPSPQSEHQHL